MDKIVISFNKRTKEEFNSKEYGVVFDEATARKIKKKYYSVELKGVLSLEEIIFQDILMKDIKYGFYDNSYTIDFKYNEKDFHIEITLSKDDYILIHTERIIKLIFNK